MSRSGTHTANHITHLYALSVHCRLARLSRIGDGTVAHELNVGRLLHRSTTAAVLTVRQRGLDGRVDRVHLEIIA